MSVINQMLKDLGERQTRSEWRLADMLDRQTPSMKLPRNYRAASALVLLGGVLAVGVLAVQQLREPSAGPGVNAAQDAVATAQTIPGEATAVIRALGIETDGASLRLVLESDKAPANGVTQVLNADGSIDYTLAGARIEAALPALAENRFIRSYAVTQRGADVILHVAPAAAAQAFIEPGATERGYRTVIGARLPKASVAARSEKPVLSAGQAATPKIQKTTRPEKQPVARVSEAKPSEQGEAKIEITRSVTPDQEANAYYRQGLEKLQADRIDAAVFDLRKAVSLQPEMHAARELLAALLLRSGHISEAYAELQRGIQLNPGYTAYARLYAQALTEAGNPAGALQVLESVEPYAAQQPDYRALMAAVAQRLGRHEDSVRHYMAALELKPSRSAWWVGMAISLEALGRAQEAARAYNTALAGKELNPDLMNYARARVAQLGDQSGGKGAGG